MYDYLNILNPEQREAATTINGPVLIIAGAGSGKTTTLIHRVAYMIDNGIEPSSILLLTFTNEAAKNMIEKASKNSNSKCENITACTYHSFCVKLLRNYGHYIHIPKDFEIISGTDGEDIIKIIKQNNKMYKTKGFPANATIIQIFSKTVNTDIRSNQEFYQLLEKDFPKYTAFCQELLNLFQDYRIYKHDHNMLDYDDLLLKTRILLRNQTVLSIVQEKYKYIMVDEYQDTNTLQEDIVFSIASKYRNLAVVGDDYQSIYKFRGSDINNILNFPNKIGQCKKIILDTNYRSTKEIINVANIIMKNHAHFGYSKQMKDANSTGKKVMANFCSTDIDETNHIFETLQKKHKKGLLYSDIAILSRTSRETARLEGLLNKHQIAYVKHGGPKFFEMEVIRDILAYLKIIINNHNVLAWSRVLDHIPGIGETYSSEISKNCNQTDFLIQNRFIKHQFYPLLQELNTFYTSLLTSQYSFKELYQQVVNYYIQLRQLKIDQLVTEDEGRRTLLQMELEDDKLSIQELWNLAKDYESIQDFLDTLILEPNKSPENQNDAVVISTIHSAKGLEWNTVFIMNCVESYLPSVHEYENKEIFDEELRCFYVAITRAKKHLILEVPDHVLVNGKSVGGLTHICKEALPHMKEKNQADVSNNYDKRYIIHCSYYEKEKVKQLGAKWDPLQKQWYSSYDNLMNHTALLSYLSQTDAAEIHSFMDKDIDYDL